MSTVWATAPFFVGAALGTAAAVPAWRRMFRRTPSLGEVMLAQIPPPSVPAAVRAELDQTPEWWVGRFHQLLEAVGAESVTGERIDTYAWGGKLVATWEDRGWRDCPCPRCRRLCR